MSVSDMDIRTIISLLFLGNLLIIIVMVSYKHIPAPQRPYGHFIAAKVLQSAGWLLLSSRGVISDLLSAYVGNTLLLSGIAFEVFSLTTVGRAEKRWAFFYTVIAASGITAFWTLASTPNLWVGYATTTAILLIAPASLSMILDSSSSRMRILIGIFCGVVSLILTLRAWHGFFDTGQFILMSRNLIQTLSFTSLFLLMIVGGSGFLLLLKEQSDELTNESEKKYRTLVEKANESICIVQDGKVVFANRTTEELLGIALEDIVGRSFTDFIFHEDLDRVMAMYKGRVEQRDVPDSYDFRVINKTGEPVWVMISATLIEYGGRQATLALITNINSLKLMEKEREKIIGELKKALADVKTLSGLLPICAFCKKIRNDEGYWEQIESYIRERSEAEFSHSYCPDCVSKLYPELKVEFKK